MDENREINIDLRKIFYMLRSKVIYIVLITVLFAISAGLFTNFLIEPVYSATVSMCVYSNPDRVTTDQSISSNELTAARDLVETYAFVLKSNLILDQVAEELNLGTAADIKPLVATSTIEGTFVFRVIVSYKNPQVATDIANTIAKIAPEEMAKAVNAGGVRIIDTAKLPREPSSPNMKKNIVIGAAIGFILSFAAFFVYELFDTTITNAKDLEREFEFPVLGTVPMIDGSEKTNKSIDENLNEFSNILSEIEEPVPKPSSSLLESIQSAKGESNND